MEKVDINTLIDKNNCLLENIPSDIIIVGEINELIIRYNYNKLDLSQINCNKIEYNGEFPYINHILPNNLLYLDIIYCKLNKLPILPNSLKQLFCFKNNLINLPNILPMNLEQLDCSCNKIVSLDNIHFPNSLKYLNCSNNQIRSFTNIQIPNSLEELVCCCNKLKELPILPNSLKFLLCSNNKIKYLKKLPDNLELHFEQYNPIEYLDYNPKLKMFDINTVPIKINGYNKDIWDQQDLNKYMDLLFTRAIKSARK